MFVAMTLFCRCNNMERKNLKTRGKKHSNSTKSWNLDIHVANVYPEKNLQKIAKYWGNFQKFSICPKELK